MRAHRPVRTGAVLVLAAFLPAATVGCFGSFSLTRKIYRFNRDVSADKWIRWLAFLVMNVVPVYGFGMVLDAIFFNSVEFWTGNNPVAAVPGTRHVATTPEGARAELTVLARDRARLVLTEPTGRTHELTLVRDADTVRALDPSGRELASVAHVTTTPTFSHADAGAPRTAAH